MRVTDVDRCWGQMSLTDGTRSVRVRAPEISERDWRPGDLVRVDITPVLQRTDGPLARRARWR